MSNIVRFYKILSIVETFNGDNVLEIIDKIVSKKRKCTFDCVNKLCVPLKYTHPEIDTIHLLKYILIKHYEKGRIGLPFWISWRSNDNIFQGIYRYILLKARMKNKLPFKEFQKRMNDHLNLQNCDFPEAYVIHDTTDVLYMNIFHIENIKYYKILTKKDVLGHRLGTYIYKIQ